MLTPLRNRNPRRHRRIGYALSLLSAVVTFGGMALSVFAGSTFQGWGLLIVAAGCTIASIAMSMQRYREARARGERW